MYLVEYKTMPLNMLVKAARRVESHSNLLLTHHHSHTCARGSRLLYNHGHPFVPDKLNIREHRESCEARPALF
jgi:hypothetical protein